MSVEVIISLIILILILIMILGGGCLPVASARFTFNSTGCVLHPQEQHMPPLSLPEKKKSNKDAHTTGTYMFPGNKEHLLHTGDSDSLSPDSGF